MVNIGSAFMAFADTLQRTQVINGVIAGRSSAGVRLRAGRKNQTYPFEDVESMGLTASCPTKPPPPAPDRITVPVEPCCTSARLTA